MACNTTGKPKKRKKNLWVTIEWIELFNGHDLDIVMLNRKEVGNPQCCHKGKIQIIERSLICLSRQNLGPFGKIETFSGLLFLLYRTCSQKVHFNHLKSVLTLIPLWQPYMLDYFDKNYDEYEAGFESRGDFD